MRAPDQNFVFGFPIFVLVRGTDLHVPIIKLDDDTSVVEVFTEDLHVERSVEQQGAGLIIRPINYYGELYEACQEWSESGASHIAFDPNLPSSFVVPITDFIH